MKRTLLYFGATLTLVGGAMASTDYAPAIWRQAYSGHWYTSGYGHKFCVVHDMEGYYLSSISYMQKSTTQGSAHYCINGLTDSSDNGAPRGEVTQMVREAYYAWHARCWNQHSFGTEHEGFVSNPAWYTQEMYQSSGALHKHLCEVWGIAKDRNHIVGHGEKSNAAWCSWAEANLGIDAHCNTHTDPGPYWDWPRFMNIITGASSGNRVGIARTSNGQGYWIAASDGGVFSFNAPFYGSMGGQTLNSPVCGIAARPQGDGYWLVAKDGGIFAFGSAPFHGSMGGQPLNKPICGIACTQSGNGYWLVGQDGGVYCFGDAGFYGSLGSSGYTDVIGISAAWHPDGSNGYRLVRANGCTYDYNCAHLGGGEAGSLVVGIAANSSDNGFWEVRGTGQIYSYGSVSYAGGANDGSNPFIAIARGPSNAGYWLLKKDGAVFSYGDAPFRGGANF